jgi:hypothetical protein
MLEKSRSREFIREEVRTQIWFLNDKPKVNQIFQKAIPSTDIPLSSKHPLSQIIYNGFHNLHLDGRIRRPGYRNPD